MITLNTYFYELAKPATLEVTEDEAAIIFRMSYRDLFYQYRVNRATVLNVKDAAIVIASIINEGKYKLGATSNGVPTISS